MVQLLKHRVAKSHSMFYTDVLKKSFRLTRFDGEGKIFMDPCLRPITIR